MNFLNSGNVVRLPLDQIMIGKRMRSVSDTQVQNLLVMAEDTGITTPIHCRKVGAVYELIDGAHRLEATRRLGLPDIAALIVECRQDEARSMEASNNLGAARMTPLHTAVFVASWKRDYYTMHPERRPGIFKGNQHSGKVVEDMMSLTTSVAEAFAITERHARRILAAGEKLSPDEVALLEGTPRKVTLKDVEQIGRIGEDAERRAVVDALAEGRAKSASEARKVFKAEKNGIQPVIKDRVDEGFKALMAVWMRAPEAARMRFVNEHHEGLSERLKKDRRRSEGGSDA